MAQNLELKAACTVADHDRIVALLAERETEIVELNQVDRYYAVPNGRLKMRWIGAEEAELIRYHRPNATGVRLSTYHRLSLNPAQADILDAMLFELFGEKVIVRKIRKFGILGHTRIHLDAVDGLGEFVELETVLGDGPNAENVSRAEYENVVQLLGLICLKPIAGSYSDLLGEGTHA
ncbi:MAG TPA: class IV adenylate cyclase [Thermomicrobiales bacterium]|nr:class IV adenylate cyclase [Thermomicrobiales bacterium]